MTKKAFRADWYPHDAFADFLKLPAEEIGVLMQIINMIYIENAPIEFDIRHIAKSCSLGKSRCRRVVNSLINKGRVYVTSEEKISQKRCDIELKNIEERRETSQKNGKKGANSRWENQGKQQYRNGQAIIDGIANTNPVSIFNTNTSPYNPPNGAANRLRAFRGGAIPLFGDKNFDIDLVLTDGARAEAIGLIGQSIDIQNVFDDYNRPIHEGVRPRPGHPDKAFIAWCKTYVANRRCS